MSDPSDEAVPTRFDIELTPEGQVGVFADFASVWHTANTFVLDFVATVRPPQSQVDEAGEVVGTVLSGRVAARVRMPSEQIFLMIRALQEQADQWLAETGRPEPPDAFFPTA